MRRIVLGSVALSVRAAVETLFSYEPAEDGADPTWAIQICEGAAGSSYCTVSAGGDPKTSCG